MGETQQECRSAIEFFEFDIEWAAIPEGLQLNGIASSRMLVQLVSRAFCRTLACTVCAALVGLCLSWLRPVILQHSSSLLYYTSIVAIPPPMRHPMAISKIESPDLSGAVSTKSSNFYSFPRLESSYWLRGPTSVTRNMGPQMRAPELESARTGKSCCSLR